MALSVFRGIQAAGTDDIEAVARIEMQRQLLLFDLVQERLQFSDVCHDNDIATSRFSGRNGFRAPVAISLFNLNHRKTDRCHWLPCMGVHLFLFTELHPFNCSSRTQRLHTSPSPNFYRATIRPRTEAFLLSLTTGSAHCHFSPSCRVFLAEGELQRRNPLRLSKYHRTALLTTRFCLHQSAFCARFEDDYLLYIPRCCICIALIITPTYHNKKRFAAQIKPSN
jgi:hypothetical protein